MNDRVAVCIVAMFLVMTISNMFQKLGVYGETVRARERRRRIKA